MTDELWKLARQYVADDEPREGEQQDAWVSRRNSMRRLAKDMDADTAELFWREVLRLRGGSR